MLELIRNLFKRGPPVAPSITTAPPPEHERTLPRPYAPPPLEVSEGNSEADWAEWEQWNKKHATPEG